MAFERAFGPLGDEWRDEALIGIHDQLQILGAVMGSDLERTQFPRPREWSLDPDEEETSVEDEDDEE